MVSLMLLNLDILFYYRYVDDICTTVPPSKIEVLLKQFNLFHSRLQFTTEIGREKINLLNITISSYKKRFIFDWYRKPTFSGKFLNFNSNYPIAQKEIQFFCYLTELFYFLTLVFIQKI